MLVSMFIVDTYDIDTSAVRQCLFYFSIQTSIVDISIVNFLESE